MRILLGTVGLLVALSWTAASAHAGNGDAEDDYAKSGIYLGGGVGIGLPVFDVDGVDLGEAIGFDVRFGYRVAPNFAAEVQLDYVFDFKDSELKASLDAMALTANAKVFLLTGDIQPYALIGLGVGRQTGNFGDYKGATVGYVNRFGAGVDFYGSDDDGLALSVGASYVLGTGDLASTRYVSITAGLQYRF